MFKIVLGVAAALVLPGCIPFIGGGTGYPDPLPGYTAIALTQQEPAAVAACIGRLLNVQPTTGEQNEYRVSSSTDDQVVYAVRSVTKKGYTQTQIMMRIGEAKQSEDSNIARCAANSSYVAGPAT